MAASRMKNALQPIPLALLVVLEIWTLTDLLSVDDRRWAFGFGLLWLANVILLGLSAGLRWRWARWAGLVCLGSAYVGVHGLVLGVPLLPALGFLALLIAQVEMRILADRFGPLFAATISRAERRKIAGALVRAVFRLAVALVLAIVVPILAADLSATGVVPLTTIPSAFLLAAALVAVIVVLALLPALEQRASESRVRMRGGKG